MKYLRLFETHAQYEAFLPTEEFIRPNVSYCKQPGHVHYNQITSSDKYLTLIALEDESTFTFNGTTVNDVVNTASYSLDGVTWTEISSGTSTPAINSGEKIMWKGEMTPYYNQEEEAYKYGIGKFTSTKTFNVEGNPMSLLYGNNFRGINSLSGKNGIFGNLFAASKVVDASKLSLETEVLSPFCYARMFMGCTQLVQLPELPSTTLAEGCYYWMFYRCTELNQKLVLPATTLTNSCYNSMFYLCTNLTTTPDLPATTLAVGCYEDMFYNCRSLTKTPTSLPVMTLAESCYAGMFMLCTSLTTPPELPATTLATYCYSGMFNGCTSLVTTPELPAEILADSCYQSMFRSCTSLTNTPTLSATTLASQCYKEMFAYCTSLQTVPSLSATDLTERCYDGMFRGCTSLVTAQTILPATTLSKGCYEYMFSDCTSLTTAPELPALTLVDNCYYCMFWLSSKLNYVKAMFTTTPSNNQTSNWLNGVSRSGTFVKNSAATWNVTGINGIPSGWTVQTASA